MAGALRLVEHQLVYLAGVACGEAVVAAYLLAFVLVQFGNEQVDVGLGYAESLQREGHAQHGAEERPQLCHGLDGRRTVVRSLYAEDAAAELCHFRWFVVRHEGHPCREHDGKARAVGHAVDRAEFVLHRVACPVLLAAAAGQAVVRQGGGPLYVGAGVVVGRIGECFRRHVHESHEQSFGQAVGHLHASGGGEVAFHDVAHHVHDSARRLPGREGECQLGVDDGKARPQYAVGAEAYLVQAFAAGDDGIAAALAAGAGDGEHHTHGQGFLYDGLSGEEVPEIAFVGNACRDGFGGVYDRAAAHGEQAVDVAVASELYSLVHERVDGIGLDSAQLYDIYAYGAQGVAHTVEEPVGLDVFLPVDKHDPARSRQIGEHSGLFLAASAEFEEGGGIIGEVIHNVVYIFGFITACGRRLFAVLEKYAVSEI